MNFAYSVPKAHAEPKPTFLLIVSVCCLPPAICGAGGRGQSDLPLMIIMIIPNRKFLCIFVDIKIIAVRLDSNPSLSVVLVLIITI